MLPRRHPSLATILLVPLLAGLVGCAGGTGGTESEPSPAPTVETSTAADPAAWFEEVAGPRGLAFVHRSGADREEPLFPEILGGAVALADLDGDGDLDAYAAQGGDLRAGPDAAVANAAFENVGDGRFRPRTGTGAEDPGYAMGVAAADYDGDGDVDLYVTNLGPNVLLRNDGGWRFTDVTDEAGVGDPAWATGATFADYDGDGRLDLFVVNYVRWTPAVERNCYNGAGVPDYCHPNSYDAPATDTLYRNLGGGRFEDVTGPAGIRAASGNGMGVVADDFDGDGRIDFLVANDSTPNQLWLGGDDGRFVDEAMLRGAALAENGKARAGMGVATIDLDEDLDVDVLVVNMDSQPDSLYRNEGPYFVDATGEAGLSAGSRRFTRFGVGFHDFDNDGWLDLYEANGRVVLAPDAVDGDPYAQPNALWRGLAGDRFELVEPPGGTVVPVIATSRGAAFGDVDDDGGIDVLVGNRDGPLHLFRNVRPGRGHWLTLRVVDGDRDAIGATLVVRAGGRSLLRRVRTGASYAAASDPRVHVGLGETTAVESVEVRWPDGASERFAIEEIDRVVTLRRGRGGRGEAATR